MQNKLSNNLRLENALFKKWNTTIDNTNRKVSKILIIQTKRIDVEYLKKIMR